VQLSLLGVKRCADAPENNLLAHRAELIGDGIGTGIWQVSMEEMQTRSQVSEKSISCTFSSKNSI